MTPVRPLLLLLALTVGFAADTAPLKAKGLTISEKAGVVTGVNGDAKTLTTDDYRVIGSLTTLTSLRLNGAKTLDDAAMALLAPLVELRDISLEGSNFTDEGCKHFAAFTKLRSLALFHPSRSNPAFTGAGLAHLSALPEFDGLTLAGANTGDAAMHAIAKLQRLSGLRLWHNLETADGLKALSGMTSLKKLTLGQRLPGRPAKPPSFTNATLADLAKMTGLEELSLMEARLSGEALLTLKGLPKLKKLSVSQVDTPTAEVEKLKMELPKVTIDWKPLTEEQAKMLTEKLKL